MILIWATLLTITFIFLVAALYTRDSSYFIHANIYAAASLLAVGMIE